MDDFLKTPMLWTPDFLGWGFRFGASSEFRGGSGFIDLFILLVGFLLLDLSGFSRPGLSSGW